MTLVCSRPACSGHGALGSDRRCDQCPNRSILYSSYFLGLALPPLYTACILIGWLHRLPLDCPCTNKSWGFLYPWILGLPFSRRTFNGIELIYFAYRPSAHFMPPLQIAISSSTSSTRAMLSDTFPDGPRGDIGCPALYQSISDSPPRRFQCTSTSQNWGRTLVIIFPVPQTLVAHWRQLGSQLALPMPLGSVATPPVAVVSKIIDDVTTFSIVSVCFSHTPRCASADL